MGIATGYLCLGFMLVLLTKYPARKFAWMKINRLLMKCHKYAVFAFLLTGILHFILVLPVLQNRMAVVTVSGLIAVMGGIGILVFCHTMKDDKKKLRVHRALSILLLCTVLVHISFYFIDLHRYRSAIQQISVQEIDLNTISDGIYIGDFDTGYIYAKVQVTVQAHRIVSIELLEHRNERGVSAERVLRAMLSGQTIQVDAVSGATNSSLVIEKACENALLGD